jgi:hypothetical protein
MTKRRDDWIDDDEYPDERDVEQFGDDSPTDYDPLTIGRVPGVNPPFWTRGKFILLVIVLLVVAALLLPSILPLLR